MIDQSQDNESYIKDNLIYVHLRGQLTAEKMHQTTVENLKLADKLRDIGHKPKYIFDISELTGHDAPAREAALEAFETDPSPTALVGGDVALNLVSMWLSSKAGQDDITKTFATTEEAITWLSSLD